jgi:3-methyladenine DNA glycosylase AlkD
LVNASTVTAEDIKSEIVDRVRSLRDGNTPRLRALRREFSKRLVDAPAQLVLKLATALVDLQASSFRFVAYELVRHHRGAANSLNEARLKRLGRGLDSWGAVDCFAYYLSGPAWRAHQVPDALIHHWARSRDRWWRRAALVSTVPLNNRALGGKGDAARTLAVCEILIADRDDMVVKALSWALRQLIVHDREAVREFLSRHEDVIARRVLREVKNKLNTGLKNSGRKTTR